MYIQVKYNNKVLENVSLACLVLWWNVLWKKNWSELVRY